MMPVIACLLRVASLIHALAQIDQSLVRSIYPNKTESWVFNIQNHVNSHCHGERKRNDVNPAGSGPPPIPCPATSAATSEKTTNSMKTIIGGWNWDAIVRVVVTSIIELSAGRSSIMQGAGWSSQ